MVQARSPARISASWPATVNPYAVTGQAPATSAVALGKAEAAVANALSSVQSALGSL
jgi:hypothetical protein